MIDINADYNMCDENKLILIDTSYETTALSVMTPSPTVSPIPVLRFSLRNEENDEWMQLAAAATRKLRRIRDKEK